LDKEIVSAGFYVSEIKLIQSWRYKSLAVIKRHKSHLSLSDFVEILLAYIKIKYLLRFKGLYQFNI